jgi:3-deoxy-D-manno-octulosonate 8-phosphate phosphatase (KDO 8-P phosphatase)
MTDHDRCAPIAMLVLDVDGVLSDGRIVYSERGDEIKAFHVRDGTGIKLWMGLGGKVAIITGRASPIVARRASELGITAVIQGVDDKLGAWERLLAENDVMAREAAYMGDDVIDLPVMRRAGLALTVADACPEALAAAHHVTKAAGGRGAVREAVEWIVKAQGRWAEAIARFTR